MSERRLISVRRSVGGEQFPAYDEAWHRFQREAVALGAHAWRFRSAASSGSFLEFLEFKDPRDPRAHPAVHDALDALERLAPGAAEEWREA
jgi:hypothetical protein